MPFERALPFLMLLNAGALYVAGGMAHHTRATVGQGIRLAKGPAGPGGRGFWAT